MKIKIKSLPKTTKYTGKGPAGPRTGDQMNYGLFSNQAGTIDTNTYQKMPGFEDVRGTYPEVDRDEANIEVELGEIIVSPDLSTIYKAAGKKHSKGGTPIQAKEGSYIVSDYIKTNPVVKEMLGFEPGNDKKETWAKFLSKNINTKYYNSLAAIMMDKEKGKPVDPYAYNTAKNKLPDYQELVGKVALGNEISKALLGKEYKIPDIALGALQSIQVPNIDEDTDPLYRMQGGGTTPAWLTPWLKSNTDKGSLSPTNQRTTYSGQNNSMYDDYNYWKQQNDGKDFNSLGDYQKYVYQRVLEADPGAVANMWRDYGQTGASGSKSLVSNDMLFNWDKTPNAEDVGSTDLISNFADGKYSGVRTEALTKFRYKPNPTLQEVTVSATRKKPTAATTSNPAKPLEKKDPIEFGNNPIQYKQSTNAFNVIALGEAISNPINTYYPSTQIPDVQYMNPQLDDPNYYPIQAAQRTRMDMLNQISNPSMARAVGSYQPDQINGIINETQRAHGNNLSTVNGAKQFNTQTYNNYAGMFANLKNQHYDKTIMSQEQRDIARRLKSQDIRGVAQNMVGNMQKMQFMKTMFPQYSMTGPFWNNLQFDGGKDFGSLYGAPTGQGMSREQFLASNPGYSRLIGTADEYKIDDAIRDENYKGTSNYFKNSKNFSQNAINPMFLQFMQNMGYPPVRG